MKKISLLIVLGSLIFGCTSQSEQNEKIAAKNVENYGHVWDVVINEGRSNILDTAYAENVVLHTVPETKGKAAAKAYYEKEISTTQDQLNNLQSNPGAVEKYARERYLLRRDGEEVYLFEDTLAAGVEKHK